MGHERGVIERVGMHNGIQIVDFTIINGGQSHTYCGMGAEALVLELLNKPSVTAQAAEEYEEIMQAQESLDLVKMQE